MNEQAPNEGLTGDALLLRRKRALYRAQYRGTKEMDWMIGRYAADKLETMTTAELETFEAFLQLGDPLINGWLLAGSKCEDPQWAGLVEDIRKFHSIV